MSSLHSLRNAIRIAAGILWIYATLGSIVIIDLLPWWGQVLVWLNGILAVLLTAAVLLPAPEGEDLEDPRDY